MTKKWTGVDHACEDVPGGGPVERSYPEFHWLGEGPNDPPDHPVAAFTHEAHRKVLVCDACGSAYQVPYEVPDVREAVTTFVNSDMRAQHTPRVHIDWVGRTPDNWWIACSCGEWQDEPDAIISRWWEHVREFSSSAPR